MRSKGQNIFFLKEVMLHIKLKGMEHRVPCKHKPCHLYTHPLNLGWGQSSKYFFLKVVMLHIKVMGVVHRAKYMPIFSVHTPSSPDVRSRGQNTYYSKISHVAIQFKGSRA